jgi:hypothetical protein
MPSQVQLRYLDLPFRYYIHIRILNIPILPNIFTYLQIKL